MADNSKSYFPPIGVIRTCFKEKFGVPRQSLMVKEAKGILKLNPDPNYLPALSELETFSHLWIIFVFHQAQERSWRPKIDPPKLDASKKVGVFASRSPHRPNPIGMSVVKLEGIDYKAKEGIEIHLSGIDLLDGTPVLDIKPYLPYSDIVSEANSGWVDTEIPKYEVSFSHESLEQITQYSKHTTPRLLNLITQMLEWDPRPTAQRRSLPMSSLETESMQFAFRLHGLDIHWVVKNKNPHVTEVRWIDLNRAEAPLDYQS